MRLHNVKLLKRDRGLLGSIGLQGDGTAVSSGTGTGLMITLSVNQLFPSAWDAVGYTYSFVGYEVDEGDALTEHTHPRLYYVDEEHSTGLRQVRLSAVERP
jgi:hypothetical protein